MATLLLQSFCISIAINAVFFLIAYRYQTDKFTDLTYSVTFIVIAIFAYSHSTKNVSHALVLALIVLWALRLGGFLIRRVHAIGRDDRFDSFRPFFFKFLAFWTMQTLTCFIVSLSALLIFANSDQQLNPIFLAGITLTFLGLVFEAVADQQKYNFKTMHPNKFMRKGLWKYLRHPNYSGEIVFWLGLCIASFGGSANVFAIISPIWISFILIKFSGIPLLRDKWEKNYGEQKAFQEYKKNSWYLFPYIY